MAGTEDAVIQHVNVAAKINIFLVDLENLKAENAIPEKHNSLFESMVDILNDFNLIVNDMKHKFEVFESKISTQGTVINLLCEEKTRLDGLVVNLNRQVDDQANYTRRNQLLIHGMEEEDGERTTEKVLKLFSEKLNIENITEDALDRTHRIGRRDMTRSTRGRKAKVRPIIVKFISYQDRKNVFDNKKRLKGFNYSISENLSKSRYDLYHKCQDHFGKNHCWTYDQRILCKNSRNEIVNITNEEDFHDDQRYYVNDDDEY